MSILVTILIYVLIFILLYWLITILPIPAPIAWARIVLFALLVIAAIIALLQLIGVHVG